MADAPAKYRCNHPAELAVTAGEASWANPHLRYFIGWVAYAGVNPARVRANYAAACAQIAAVCGATFTESSDPNAAEVVARSAPIDGPWNVLAISQLPPGPGYAGVLTQTFDNAERLDDPTMVAMMAHELGHILGLGHLPAGNLMAPELDPRYMTPQPGDVAELQARYGPPAVLGGAVPSSPEAPGSADPAAGGPQSIAIEIAGVGTLTLAIAGFTPAAS